MMRELDAIELSVTDLRPGLACTLLATQPYPSSVLLSHVEVTELLPRDSAAALTELRVEQLHYLIAPVSLQLLESEQRRRRHQAEQQLRRKSLELIGPLGLQIPWARPDRRATRLTALDIHWRPGQQLRVGVQNSGELPIHRIVIELVLYAATSLVQTAN